MALFNRLLLPLFSLVFRCFVATFYRALLVISVSLVARRSFLVFLLILACLACCYCTLLVIFMTVVPPRSFFVFWQHSSCHRLFCFSCASYWPWSSCLSLERCYHSSIVFRPSLACHCCPSASLSFLRSHAFLDICVS